MPDQAEIIIIISRRDWGGFFDALDVNKDGYLSHQEFWKWEKSEILRSSWMLSTNSTWVFYEILRKNYERILKEADRNKDHKLSRAEFICHMNLCKYITDDRWDALFDELDVDGNGVLCHSEFWSKMAIKNSSDLVNALKQFDVSSSITPKIQKIIVKIVGNFLRIINGSLWTREFGTWTV